MGTGSSAGLEQLLSAMPWPLPQCASRTPLRALPFRGPTFRKQVMHVLPVQHLLGDAPPQYHATDFKQQ